MSASPDPGATASDREPIGVVGVGWVGSVTAACFAELGHPVVAVDVDAAKVEALRRGEPPIHEPGLDELLARNRGRLTFTTEIAAALEAARLLFVCVDTPPTYSGDADLSRVRAVVGELRDGGGHALVMKSTVPAGTGEAIRRDLPDVAYVSCPEFLKEGSAVDDFLHPDRVVIGADPGEEWAADAVAEVYGLLGGEVVRTDVASAEMIKLASNAFLATKISFINEIANVCEEVGADVTEVARGMGLDRRIGPSFLRAGIGYGGSCVLPEETVLVRWEGTVTLVPLGELFERFAEVLPASKNGSSGDVGALLPDGLEVLAWDSRDEALFLPVAAITRRPYAGEVLEVRTKMGRRVKCTPDHPFVVADAAGSVGEPKLARELTEADWLPLARRDRLDGQGGEEALNLLEGRVLADLTREQVMVRPAPEEVASVAAMGATERKAAVPRPRGPHRLIQVLGLGRNCYEQRLPDRIWEAPVEAKRAVLAGLWRGDGSWSQVAGGPSVTLEFGTASRELADGVLRLLADLGVVASLRIGRTAKSTRDNYWVTIAGADQVERCLFLVSEPERARIRESIARQTKRIASTGYRVHDGDTAWVRVTSISPQPFDGFVYSLEVPGARTFVTSGGIVIHNCFPKDTQALKQLAGNTGYHFQLLTSVIEVNELQKRRVIGKLEKHLDSLAGRKVALLGLAFKPDTDDMRDASSLVLAARLRGEGAEVLGYDPVAEEAARELLPEVELRDSVAEAVDGADAAVLVTEWPEFAELDWGSLRERMATPLVIDGRNFLDPAEVREAGLVYEGIGRAGQRVGGKAALEG